MGYSGKLAHPHLEGNQNLLQAHIPPWYPSPPQEIMLSSQSSSSSSVTVLDVLVCSGSTVFSPVMDDFSGTREIKSTLVTSHQLQW